MRSSNERNHTSAATSISDADNGHQRKTRGASQRTQNAESQATNCLDRLKQTIETGPSPTDPDEQQQAIFFRKRHLGEEGKGKTKKSKVGRTPIETRPPQTPKTPITSTNENGSNVDGGKLTMMITKTKNLHENSMLLSGGNHPDDDTISVAERQNRKGGNVAVSSSSSPRPGSANGLNPTDPFAPGIDRVTSMEPSNGPQGGEKGASATK